MLTRYRIFCAILFIAFPVVRGEAQMIVVERSLTLSQCIQFALENNKQILQAKEVIGGAEAKVNESRSSYFPQVRLESNYTRLNTFSTFKFALPGFPSEEIKLGTANNYSTQVSLYQSLFTWGRNNKMVEVSEAELTLTGQNILLTEREISYMVVQLFYRILTMQEGVKVMNEHLGLLEQRLSMMRKKYEAGETSNFDLLSTEVQISSAKGQKLDAETSLRKVQLEFNKIIGRSVATVVQLQDSMDYRSLPLDETTLLREALANRVELKQVQNQEKLMLLQKEITSTMNKPNVDAYFNWNLRNGYLPNVDIFKGSWNAGLSFTLPLFDGFRTRAQESKAEANLRVTQIQHEEIKQSVEIEVRQAYLDLKTAEAKIEIERIKKTQAEQALRTAEDRYEGGRLSTLDLLDVQQSLESARLNYLQAIYICLVSKYTLEKLTGKKFVD